MIMPRNQLLSKIDMDFNSNDEYLKAFPPNFSPKLEGLNMLNQLLVSDFQIQKDLFKNQKRNNEMVLEESNGEPCELGGETALSLQAIRTRVFGDETLSDTQVEGPPSTIETTQETTIHCKIPVEDVITIGVIKDSILALNNISDHYKAKKSVLEEAIEVATMNDEAFGLPTLGEFVKGTQLVPDQERPITDIDTMEGNATMDTKTLQDVQNGQLGSTLGNQIEVVEDTKTTLIETFENIDAIGQIETKEPITIEMIKMTAIRATYEIQTSHNEETEHTQIESKVLGTKDASMAKEITKKTTIKAKAICPYEGEELGLPSASNSTTGLEDLDTCSDADGDKVVDSIMNDIADIEPDMKVKNVIENEVDIKSNAQYQGLEICGKAIGRESMAICQDYMGSQV